MLATAPLVSVVVPAFNAEVTIARTLQSIVAQTYKDLEIIVVNDGSTDGTAGIVEGFVRADPRVRLVCQPNGGVASARNHGLRIARGTYFAPIDADDVWAPENIYEQVTALEAGGPSVTFSFAASFIIDEADRRRERTRPRPKARADYVGLLRRNWVGNGSAAVFRRDAVVAAGGYDESLRARKAQGAEDWKLALKLAAKGTVIALPKELIGYRDMPNSMSMDPVTMTRSTMLVIDEMRRFGPRLPPWHFWHARTTVHIGLFYRWIYAGRWGGACLCLIRAYLANPLWFTQRDARDFLFSELGPHVFSRLMGRQSVSNAA